jgi:hypothetical protein
MVTMKLNSNEAAALKRRRAKNKAHNATIGLAVDTVKKRLKNADAIEAATLTAVLQDMRKLIR